MVHKPTKELIGCTKIQWGVYPMNNISSVLRRHKGLISSVALVLAVALIFWAVNSPSIVGASAATRELPIYNVQRDNKAVSLTFDAA